MSKPEPVQHILTVVDDTLAQSKSLASGQAGALVARAAPPAALDLPTYQRLVSTMGANDTTEIYAICLSDIAERMQRMPQHIARGDEVALRREGHAIKGGCGMLGARELYLLADALEHGAGERTPIEYGELVHQVREAAKRLRMALEEAARRADVEVRS